MTDILKAQCESADGDYITAERSDGKVKFEAFRHRDYTVNVFVSPGSIRTFANGLLALAEEIDGSAPEAPEAPGLVVGDRVIIPSGEFSGQIGELIRIDDDSLPYLIRLPDSDTEWFTTTRKAEVITDRAALLTRARVIDPNATGAGLVEIARFLSE